MSPLSFDNEWTDHNADYCVNTVDERNYYGYFAPVTPEILWFICMCSETTQAKIRCALVFKVIR